MATAHLPDRHCHLLWKSEINCKVKGNLEKETTEMPPYKTAPPQWFMENKNVKSQGKN